MSKLPKIIIMRCNVEKDRKAEMKEKAKEMKRLAKEQEQTELFQKEILDEVSKFLKTDDKDFKIKCFKLQHSLDLEDKDLIALNIEEVVKESINATSEFEENIDDIFTKNVRGRELKKIFYLTKNRINSFMVEHEKGINSIKKYGKSIAIVAFTLMLCSIPTLNAMATPVNGLTVAASVDRWYGIIKSITGICAFGGFAFEATGKILTGNIKAIAMIFAKYVLLMIAVISFKPIYTLIDQTFTG